MKITRLGHSMFRIDSVEGKVLLVDPWIKGNPTCPEEYKNPEKLKEIDAILITHGHFDHTNGVKEIQDANPNAVLYGQYEQLLWMISEGATNPSFLNIGGTDIFHNIKITMVTATHTSGYREQVGKVQYAGTSSGYVITLENDYKIYISGDTGLTADMTIIRDYYKPDLVVLSVADVLTMGPDAACYAAGTLLDAKHVIPCHDYPEPTDAPSPVEMEQTLEDLPLVHKLLNRSEQFKTLMAEKHPHIKVTVLGYGESLELSEFARLK
ncbi:metal-dependent hydrolase [Ectobacillus funiculus]|uniref:metal-dependent hydrolase n=1 Tax=Ectobacillus funiculus TaxID=137993 RepID=UPI00397AA8B9